MSQRNIKTSNGKFNLASQLAFYGAYHNNRWNQLIHFFFVPLILWGVLVWAAEVKPGYAFSAWIETWVPAVVASLIPMNGATVIITLFASIYSLMDIFSGISWLLAVGAPLLIAATPVSEEEQSRWYGLAAIVIGFYVQIHFGHILFEGRRPALIDSFVQALLTANLFVWMELLFFLGYRPALKAAVQAAVCEDIKEWKQRMNEKEK